MGGHSLLLFGLIQFCEELIDGYRKTRKKFAAVKPVVASQGRRAVGQSVNDDFAACQVDQPYDKSLNATVLLLLL